MLLQGWNSENSAPSGSNFNQESDIKTVYTVHVTQNNRLYYCNQETKTASWIPPPELWCGSSLPYGFEQAVDSEGKPYFINHVTKSTMYDDPRLEWEDDPRKPRTVELFRDPDMGFGFVAGSERPVLVRYVIENGPSEGKLLPGDMVLSINDEDVQNTPREQVIQMVRDCVTSVKLKVRQPLVDNTGKKSALLSSAKKAKLKTNPSRVRFAEGVIINGSPVSTPFSGGDANVPPIPNILKVFLENGQTKSFKYDSNTKVRDVITSLQNKLCIKAIDHFALVLEQVKGLRRNKLILLNPDHTIAKIASRPGAHNLRCLFRVAFVPKDACILAQEDLVAFEYLYMQCCNDVVQERYAPELKYDTALRLAALHIHQHAISNNIPYNKVTVKSVEKEFGLEKFVPVSLMESMKRKELRKLLTHLLKLNQTITGTAHKTLTSLQAKLYYLTIIAELPSYGTKCFQTNIRECNMETLVVVSPKYGISQLVGPRNSMPTPIVDIEDLEAVRIQPNDQVTSYVSLYTASLIQKELRFTMEDRDAEEFVLVLQGYYRLFTGQELVVNVEKDFWMEDAAPVYHSRHLVIPAGWSYRSDSDMDGQKFADFSIYPPYTSLHASNVCETKVVISSHPKYFKFPSDSSNVYSPFMTEHNGYLVNRCPNGADHSEHIPNILSVGLNSNIHSTFIEAHNKEVLRRVTEMQEVVQNSEQYLNQQLYQKDYTSSGPHMPLLERENTPPPGQLKHSDSLLLLTQCQKEVNDRFHEIMQALQIDDVESDTDSVSTPSGSPSHTVRNRNRDSDTSFGLHSPDSVSSVGQYTLQDLWMKMRSQKGTDDAEESLYHFEPDVIDLTLIPPPSESCDKADVKEIVMAPPPAPPAAFNDDSSLLTSVQQQRHDQLLDSVLSNSLESSQLMNLDLDSFLATMTIPPPAPNLTSAEELTLEQISSFIIPPPPVKDEKPGVPFMPEMESVEKGDTNTSVVRDNVSQPQQARIPINRSYSTLPNRTKSKTAPSVPPRTDSLYSLKRKSTSVPPSLPHNQLSNERLACTKEALISVEQIIEEHKSTLKECDVVQSHGGGSDINEAKFQDAIQELSNETRELVALSKSLVRSFMDATCNDFNPNVSRCVTQLKTLTQHCQKLVIHTASPLQTKNLIQKVLDVINTFHSFLSIATVETDVVTKQAENLANVLATLLRSLRIFSP